MSEIVDPIRSDRRRDLGLLALFGGGISMTGYAAYALWLVRHDASFVFWLGLSALALVAITLTGFAALIVKRTIRLSRDGLEISDHQDEGQGQ